MESLPEADKRSFMLNFIVAQYRQFKTHSQDELMLVYLLVFNSTIYNYTSSGKVNAILTIVSADRQKWINEGFDESLGWDAYTGEVIKVNAPGDHFNMIDDENGKALGNSLNTVIAGTNVTDYN